MIYTGNIVHKNRRKRGKKRTSRGITMGCSILLADGEGFEPPEALRLQRFSRPSHSTALPPILKLAYACLFYIYFFLNANIFCGVEILQIPIIKSTNAHIPVIKMPKRVQVKINIQIPLPILPA